MRGVVGGVMGLPCLPGGPQIISVILDITTGKTTTITNVGGSDEVWYNPGDNRYYLAARDWTTTGLTGGPLNPVLGIIDAGSNTFIANVPTAIGVHSVAVDPTNQAAFVPLPNGAVGVFTRAAFTPGAPLGQPPAGPTGPGGCALSPGAAFDPILVGLLGLLGLHLGLRCLGRRRGKALSKPSVRS